MASLLEYFNHLSKDYEYRIKMVFEPTDEQLDCLESHLKKYDVQRVGKVERIMLQSRPTDFADRVGYEIYVVDAVTKLPASMQVLAAEVAEVLKVSEADVKVRSKDEPAEEEADKEEKEYEPILGKEYSKDELDFDPKQKLFGDDYNSKFIKELMKLAKERKVKMAGKADVPADQGPQIGQKIAATSPISGKK